MTSDEAGKLEFPDTVYVEEELVEPFVMVVIAYLMGVILGAEVSEGKPRRWCFPVDAKKVSHDGAKKLAGLDPVDSFMFDLTIKMEAHERKLQQERNELNG
jgi:hypothetical protein